VQPATNSACLLLYLLKGGRDLLLRRGIEDFFPQNLIIDNKYHLKLSIATIHKSSRTTLWERCTLSSRPDRPRSCSRVEALTMLPHSTRKFSTPNHHIRPPFIGYAVFEAGGRESDRFFLLHSTKAASHSSLHPRDEQSLWSEMTERSDDLVSGRKPSRTVKRGTAWFDSTFALRRSRRFSRCCSR